MMSTDSEADEVCANCGKAAVDDIKLKICTACKLVKYCSVDCQKNHRSKHKKACKKRATEIRDNNLFKQPDESNLGECPICCLPLPLDATKSKIYSCCSQRICDGCVIANQLREVEQGLKQKCTYCREPVQETEEEEEKNIMKRVKANDPVALYQMGGKCDEKGDYEGAIKYLTKAAELGDMEAHYNLSCMYRLGDGVEKDTKKKVYHLEEAAIGGHPKARYNLGSHEGRNGRLERAMKHFIIAANLGLGEALEMVKEGFANGDVSKEDYEAALRGHRGMLPKSFSDDETSFSESTKSIALFTIDPKQYQLCCGAARGRLNYQ